MLRAINVEELNPHIICCLCGGYLVNATTIVECLHSFCRSCIVKYLQTSFHCPVCDVEVHKTKPLLHIRPDRTLQEIVYKLVPGLYQAELKLRNEFEEKQRTESRETGETEPVKANSVHDGVNIEDPVCITLEYYRRNRNWMEKQVFPTRYLRCSSAVTVRVLKTFLEMKFAIPRSHQVEIIRCDEILNDHLTMREVSRIYGLHSKSFLDLQYAFLEPAEDDTTTKQKTAQKVPRKKRKIHKKKVKDTQVNAIQTELLSNDDKLESSRESEDLVKTFPDTRASESDILPTFPDTPPGSENVPYDIQIESPV